MARKEDCASSSRDDSEELGRFIESSPARVLPKQTKAPNSQECYIFNVFGKHKLQIYKKLIILKISLFIWGAGSSQIGTFFPLLLKQRGVSLGELSVTIAASGILQLIIPFVSGVIADKIGKAKPILLFYILLYIVLSVAFVFLPPIANVPRDSFDLSCNSSESTSSSTCEHFHENVTCSNGNVTCWNPFYSTSFDNQSKAIFQSCPPCSSCSNENATCGNLHSSQSFDNQSSVTSNGCPTCSACSRENATCINPQSQSSDNGRGVIFRSCYGGDNATTSINASSVTCRMGSNDSCHLSCEAERNAQPGAEDYKRLLILAYFVLIPLFYFMRATVNGFYDVTIVSLIAKHGSSYGMQRLWKVFGFITGNLLASYIISEDGADDYNRPLYLSLFCAALSCVLLCKIDVQPVKPNKQMLKTAGILIRNPNLFAFVLVLMVCGMSFGVEVIYFAWYLQVLGASPQLIGIISTMAFAYGLPFLVASRWLTRVLKERNIFVIALLSHGTYCLVFSLMAAPWIALVLEAFFAIAFDFFWVAVVQYCQIIAPPGMIATLIATASALHFNIGVVLAGVYGGSIVHRYDLKVMYRIAGYMAFSAAALYSAFLCCLYFCSRRASKPDAKDVRKQADNSEI